ncbi:helix-turn-helix domain-containing protein [Paenibacillus sp. GCM10023248]|uniref:helix-turn-helix domain-containing protein n=1 Tax=Bacillales TaxID=1385 RepID=UPI002378D4FC|nr:MULTISPECIES: helix-turn-helix domain-containing protein [Bacillales]MDD9268245.1 helix-turn-helix domain-containing protein [Paenibacillus sp. MAHUQ-63]MDR6879923.1 AraC-like DNA-binding protein [Bacillus sp. 3255]
MWKWKTAVLHRQSVFVKFVLSYLLILIIPIVIGVQQYYKTQQVLVEDAAEMNLQILRMSQGIVDRLFLEVDDVVSTLSVNNDVLSLMQNVSTSPTPEQLYNFSLLRNSLNQITITNKFFFDIYLTFKNSHSVITSKTSFDLRDNDIRIGGQPLEAWMEAVSTRGDQKQYYNLDSVRIGGAEHKLIAYVSPLPNGFQGKVQGSIVVFINQNDINGLFERLVIKNKGFAYILDTKGQMIAPTSVDGVQIGKPREETTASSSGSSFETINGSKLLVSHSRSDQNGWTYIAALPTSVVLAKADYIKRMIAVITGITLILGIVAAILMAYRNSKPLSELMDSMKEFAAREPGKRSGFYEMMQSTVSEIMNSNRMLSSRMEQQLPLIQFSMIERLMKGYYKNDADIQEALAQAKVSLQGDRFFAVSIAISLGEGYAIAPNGAKWIQDYIVMQLRDVIEDCDYLISLNGDRADMIVSLSASHEEAGAFTDRLKREWQAGKNGTLANNEIRLSIGIGRIYSHLHDVWRSHDEARQAADYDVFGGYDAIIWYEDIVQGSNFYYYPMDLELKLVHTVKNGDVEAFDHIMHQLEEHNHTERQLSASTRKQLVSELQGTLYKLLEQLQFGYATYDELNEKLEFMNHTKADMPWGAIKNALYIVCHHINDNKKQKHNKMADDMMQLVHAQYLDANFGLAGLADHFKCSESFISVQFKEYAGASFSDYVEKLRLDKACHLLRDTEKSINDIALEVGYNSDKSFRRAFKRTLGIQPTSYRDSPT